MQIKHKCTRVICTTTMVVLSAALHAAVPTSGWLTPGTHYQVYDWLVSSDEAKTECNALAVTHGYPQNYCYITPTNPPSWQGGWFCDVYVDGSCPKMHPFYFGVFFFTEQSFKNLGGSVCPSFGAPGAVFSGNPIHTSTGNKFQREVVYSGGSGSSLDLSFFYNSSFAAYGNDRGSLWRPSYSQYLFAKPYGSAPKIYANRLDGKRFSFRMRESMPGQWISDADVNDRLQQQFDEKGKITRQIYISGNDEIELYDATGRLSSIITPEGRARVIRYDSNGILIGVDDFAGRTLSITVNANGRISGINDPAGQNYSFIYNTNNDLTSITFPDNTTRRYHYENTALPGALTGITDENGTRYATYGYDAQGRAVSSEHAGGADRHTLNFPDTTGTATTVTDPLGSTRRYTFQNILGVSRNTGLSQPGGSGCGPASAATTYDANGNIASRTDFNGNVTTYTHDLARNLETQRLEAAGTPEARTISTQWHPDWRLATRIAEPLRITTHIYNGQPDPGNGNTPLTCAPTDALVIDKPIAVLCKTIEQATTDADGSQGFAAPASGAPRIHTWTWNRHGQMLTADGPRTDVADLTTYDYWPIDATCPGAEPGSGRDKGCRGQLRQITDPLGHTTRHTRYNAHGQLEESIDANGLVTTQTWDLRQRLVSRTVGDEITTLSYDPAGQLKQITQSDGQRLDYRYDDAHRLIGIADQDGNRIDYTLDPAGNRIGEDVFDPAGTLSTSLTRSYDALGRVQAVTGAHQP